MEYSKMQSFFVACLALNYAFAQQSSYRPESQKVQLEDIEQDNLKNVQQSPNSALPVAQYSQYPGQNQQVIYNVPSQQSHHGVSPVQTANQQAYPLFAIPTQTGASLPGQQFIYYTQSPQQFSPYELPFFGGAYPFVSQPAQPVLPSNDVYTKASSTPSKNAGNVKSAVPQVPQLPANYFYTTLPQQSFYPMQVQLPQVQNPSQYVPYNSFYPVPTSQKSVYSSGVKSTTTATPAKNSENNYRFEYNSPEFAKFRVTG